MPAVSSVDRRALGGWLTGLPLRVAACWRLKLLLSLSAGVLFCATFILLEHFPLLPVHLSPQTPLDRAIGFHPLAWVWIYQSLYLPINLIPWLARDRAELARFVRGFVFLAAVSFAIFIVFPTRVSRPLFLHPTGMYWLLQQYDTPLNAAPSLHAGMLVYAICFGRQIFRDGLPKGISALIIIWSALILYATLATKEHYVVDLLSGTALGVIAHFWAWRGDEAVRAAPGTTAAPPIAREPLHAGR